jgi:hypothetical protein
LKFSFAIFAPSNSMLLAQGLALPGAIHICNERSRTAVDFIHQFVPIRFQFLAVACQAKDDARDTQDARDALADELGMSST